jgi:hypothetical protein
MVQERFWKDSGFDPRKAKKQLESDAQWRKKMNADSILSVRCCSALFSLLRCHQ